jgi:hypothetical protein
MSSWSGYLHKDNVSFSGGVVLEQKTKRKRKENIWKLCSPLYSLGELVSIVTNHDFSFRLVVRLVLKCLWVGFIQAHIFDPQGLTDKCPC